MGIPLAEFGPLALSAPSAVELGERCTVFIETAIQSALSRGASQAEVAAGLCRSIVRNYLHKVVGAKPVGSRVVLQGGVAYNPGIVAAFQQELGERLTVSPCFPISGAYGAALLALESVSGPSCFHGFDTAAGAEHAAGPGVAENIAFYQRAGALLLEGYDSVRLPRKKTVGVPYALVIHKFFPMANAFFRNLGFNVLLSPPTNEEIIRLAQQTAQAETCYPVKLLHGHMAWLAEQGVDYIFMPSVHTMKHEFSHVEHNYGCVYMQTAPRLAANALDLERRGITLLSPGSSWEYQSRAVCPPCYPGPRRCGGIPRQWRNRGGNCWHPSGRTTRCWCSLPGTMAFPTRCSTWEFPGCCWSAGIRSSPCPTCPPITWICRRTTPICTGLLASTSCPGPNSWPTIQTCMPST